MNPRVTRCRLAFTPPGAQPGTAVYRIGCESFPELADHGFQGAIVLPGAFYFELALDLQCDGLRAPAGPIDRAEFQRPLVLAGADISIAVEIARLDGQRIRYSFREAGAEFAGAPPCATLELVDGGSELSHERPIPVSPADFQNAAQQNVDATAFYGRLRERGNHYGPRFQALQSVWRTAQEALGRLAIPDLVGEAASHRLPPRLVDAAIQLLAIFAPANRRTFILRGVEKLVVHRPNLDTAAWARAVTRADTGEDKNGFTGDVVVCDAAGVCCLELRGVRIVFADQPAVAPTLDSTVAGMEVVVAATFTAAPIADVLRFWSDELSIPIRLEFAPYQQVFQELLDPASRFRRNRAGFNVVLLNLDDWAAVMPRSYLRSSPEKIPDAFAGLNQHTLPNGRTIAHLNRHETDYVYREIFEDRCYLRHGVRVPADGNVIDIGANIGLFSLFVRSQSPRASVYAFEPSPIAFRALRANCAAYGPGLHPFNVGVSECRGQAPLTFYENSSVFSSFHADRREDRQAIRAVVANLVRDRMNDAAESPAAAIDELLADRLNSRTFDCPLISVSDIIRENGLQRVELLKVDAEKCELEILRGIEDAHWPLIEQVVVEVHDRSGAMLAEVQAILSRHGFHCAAEEENFLAGSGLANVYATRRGGESRDAADDTTTAGDFADLQGKLDEFVRALETSAAAGSATTIVCVSPRRASPERGEARERSLAALEDELLHRLRALPQVRAIGSREILERYPTAELHEDLEVENAGHIPYRPEGFAAIGTMLFRTLAGLRRPPCKAIVLDCDHTLWAGGCVDDGPRAVVVTPAHRALQEFMIRQMQAGMLLGLCSKNDEGSVWAVFAQNSGMILKREHLATARINWSAKSGNLRSLAAELNIGLDSVIFIDDNPVECAEVRAHCPDILTLQLPDDPARIVTFLDHVWAFDHFQRTAEDSARTRMLRDQARREEFRGQVATLKDFIDGLQLRVEITPARADQFARLAQLTLRTNQFNFTTRRRTEGEIRALLADETHRGLVVSVTDRFGDYGLVGLVLYRVETDAYHVNTFLLSCRVLGRGVEHRIVAALAERAIADGRRTVAFAFQPTEKNQPAADFLESLRAEFRPMEIGGGTTVFSASDLTALRYRPSAVTQNQATIADHREGSAPASTRDRLAEKSEHVAADLATVRQISAAIEAHRLRAAGFDAVSGNDEVVATPIGKLLGIWRKVLGNPRLGLDDKFLEAGGSSLQAVQLVAAIQREFHRAVPLATLFECPTVRSLNRKLEPDGDRRASANEAMARGARRKQRTGRPGTAPAISP